MTIEVAANPWQVAGLKRCERGHATVYREAEFSASVKRAHIREGCGRGGRRDRSRGSRSCGPLAGKEPKEYRVHGTAVDPVSSRALPSSVKPSERQKPSAASLVATTRTAARVESELAEGTAKEQPGSRPPGALCARLAEVEPELAFSLLRST